MCVGELYFSFGSSRCPLLCSAYDMGFSAGSRSLHLLLSGACRRLNINLWHLKSFGPHKLEPWHASHLLPANSSRRNRLSQTLNGVNLAEAVEKTEKFWLDRRA